MRVLLVVTLPGRPGLRMLATDTQELRQAVASGELCLLDKPRETGRAVAHWSARREPRVNRL